MRAFDFMVPFWGQRYRDHFVNLSLPSLLAPGNLPLLHASDGHRFLIATTAEDWRAIERLPIMERLRRHATPTWIEVQGMNVGGGPFSHAQYESVIGHASDCQRKLMETAFARHSYGSLLLPDVIYSDNTVRTLLALAEDGAELVLMPALRQIEEDVIRALTTRDFIHEDRPLSISGEALTLPPRITAELAVRHLHPEIAPYDNDGPVQRHPMPFHYWGIGDDGLLFHSFFGCPMLMDYRAVPADHTACLDNDFFEYVYISRNFAGAKNVRVVSDSDDCCALSLTPRYINWSRPDMWRGLRWPLPLLSRLLSIRRSMQHYAGTDRDRIRRDLFLTPIRLHGSSFDARWSKSERQIKRLMRLAVGDYRRGFPQRPALLDVISAAIKLARQLAWLARHPMQAPRIVVRRVSRIF